MIQCPVVQTENKGTQTTSIPPSKEHGIQPHMKGMNMNESLNESMLSLVSDNARDPEWHPIEDSDNEIEDCDTNVAKERKYIVFESCLDSLLNRCSVCGSITCVNKKTVGTCLVCDIKCFNCEQETTWRSQPLCGNMPLGNLILSAAVMFCGVSPVKVLRALDFASIQNISNSTVNLIQSAYLTPTVMSVWKKQQQSMVREIKSHGKSLKLAGDMRCCTPGHTAKYGSYTMIDLEANQVLDFQLVQVCL